MKSKFGVKAVSPVISTVVITATLMVILIISAYVATNLLEVQIENTEFEQAKTNMTLLSELIADVALRQGAASSIKINQRAGGIGIYETEAITLTLDGIIRYPFNADTKFYMLKYRGGSLVSTAETIIAGPGDPNALTVGPTEPLGLVKTIVENGAWVTLDFQRVRAVNNTDLGLTDIYIIRLEPGELGGSGTVTVSVQNHRSASQQYTAGSLTITVGGRMEHLTPFNGRVRITEVAVRVSIRS